MERLDPKALPIRVTKNALRPARSTLPRRNRIEFDPARLILGAVDQDKNAKLSFEGALTRLEAIVDSMEQGEVPLAELLAKYEEGSKLLKVCESRLKDAELKIEKLKKQKDGGAAFEPFEATRAE